MKSYIFEVAIEKDAFEDGRKAFRASCPALKGCHTWAPTEKEAVARFQEAAQLYVEDLIAAPEAVPVKPDLGAFEMAGPCVVVNVWEERPNG